MRNLMFFADTPFRLLCPRAGSPAYHHPTWSKIQPLRR
jgi:hypothetical protein